MVVHVQSFSLTRSRGDKAGTTVAALSPLWYIASMKLSNYSINTLKDVIIGDSGLSMPYLTGHKITDLFNSFCTKKEDSTGK